MLPALIDSIVYFEASVANKLAPTCLTYVFLEEPDLVAGLQLPLERVCAAPQLTPIIVLDRRG